MARYLAVGPPVPPDLSKLAEQIAEGESSPYLRALAVETFLAEHYTFAGRRAERARLPEPAASSCSATRARGGQRGTSEQFAAAFATLGRLLGLPTRVVVGFRTPPVAARSPARTRWPGPRCCSRASAGWRSTRCPQPNTRPAAAGGRVPAQAAAAHHAAAVDHPAARSAYARPTATTGGPGHRRRRQGPGATVVAAGVGGGLLALFVLALLAVVLLRALQTRGRLRRATRPRRSSGAWHEVLDALELAGEPPPRHLAAAEVAGHAARSRPRAPRPPPRPPARGRRPHRWTSWPARSTRSRSPAGTGPARWTNWPALGARAQAVEYARALYARRSWWRRLLWRIDPRPLRRRRLTDSRAGLSSARHRAAPDTCGTQFRTRRAHLVRAELSHRAPAGRG